jgi:ketosteroid isomerase-like protein
MDRRQVEAWVRAYEKAWRTPGTDAVDSVFTPEATYSPGPFERPFVGLQAIEEMWEAERDGPDELFSMTSDVVAVEGDTAVARVEVDYGDTGRPSYRDLWVIVLDETGRCTWFEEWPFWPEGEEGGTAGSGGSGPSDGTSGK